MIQHRFSRFPRMYPRPRATAIPRASRARQEENILLFFSISPYPLENRKKVYSFSHYIIYVSRNYLEQMKFL